MQLVSKAKEGSILPDQVNPRLFYFDVSKSKCFSFSFHQVYCHSKLETHQFSIHPHSV